MVKSTKCRYKRWLWTFGALTELDVVVANINIQLTAPNTNPDPNYKEKNSKKKL